jgi:predicted component of type VI protein secretion system
MPSRLIVYEDDAVVGEHALGQERVRIGRKPHNDLVLPHTAVSGEHAVVITVRNDSFLEDLYSTNGTWVNGKVVTKCLLRDGDEIRIARYLLKYRQGSGVAEVPVAAGYKALPIDGLRGEESGMDAFIQTTKQPTFPVAAADNLAASPDEQSLPFGALRAISGPAAGKEVDLTRTLTTLGKPGIQMAVIARREEGYFLAYLEGANYPLVNGVPAEEEEQVFLNHLDDVEIAGMRMKFLLKRPPLVEREA